MPPKSGHNRAKKVNYDDDDDGYSDESYEEEEGDGMSMHVYRIHVCLRLSGMTDEDRGIARRK